jgi:hypothetical protein
MRIAIALLLLLAAPALADSCDEQIPASLKEALGNQLSAGYRTPQVKDNLAPDVEWHLRQGGNGCLGAAVADFDGDGVEDVLLRLPEEVGQGALIVVALARLRGSWRVEPLSRHFDGRSTLYVRADKPGVYRRPEALDGPLEAGEADPLTCAHAAAVSGTVESSAVVHCYGDGRWQHVWISD